MSFEEEFVFEPFTPELKVFDMIDVQQILQCGGQPHPLPIQDMKVFDYHGSTSVSPSSSLSSPSDLKADFGVDFSSPLCVNAFSGSASFLHSPASCSSSPFGTSFQSSCPSQNASNSIGTSTQNFSSMCGSPLPPMSHFSMTPQQQAQQQAATQPQRGGQPMQHGYGMHPGMMGQPFFVQHIAPHQAHARSPSPPLSESECALDDGSGLVGLQGQQRTRSKMHEMAVRQKLITDQQDGRGSGCVLLSAEEKRTLLQEGYPIPTKLPLTKAEEESLKIVRRKIKNKLSAQESRRKRKEYMDSLEQRVQLYFNENQQLKHKLKQLEMSNRSMMNRMKQLEQMMVPSVLPDEGMSM